MPANAEPARESASQGDAVLTVSALNRSVRDLLEHRFPPIWVAGEVSNLTLARSGHAYFSLKDAQAQVRCVMFRHRGQLLDWTPRDGMQVEVRALVTLYEPRGDFQLNVEFMRRAGLGALYEAFVRLRDRLAAEGLFAEEIKQAIPAFPRAIGVVTSLGAAALHDVLTTLARRNPSIPVVVFPAAVQGDGAPAEIVAALGRAARRAECDVLILCRGGGSIEDLRSFNDERVARAIRACPIPVVVGVGHETDVTIADFAADRRAPTPTAAAELASPPRAELLARIAADVARLRRRFARDLETRMQLLDHLSRRLVHPGRRLQTQAAMLAQLRARLAQATERAIERKQWRVARLTERARRSLPPVAALAERVDALGQRLRGTTSGRIAHAEARLRQATGGLGQLDPKAVLGRGYAMALDAHGRVVRDGAGLRVGERLELTFGRGGAGVRVEDKA
ncbi:MAG: exodeoxyribonuclease VII large subunit [Burkholderiales bacterium]|nr:exodeoxyribonuclease VII large subunit [Burkholderiales bacterium]